MDMKRLVMTMVAAGATLAAVAMPTKAELQKAQEMVSDVTAADMKALRTKAKTPAEVAAKHMELAGQAGNEAEKYILLQGAFKLYAKAGDYEGAANALGTMNREIADMNPEVIVEIYNRAIFSSMKEKAPKLHAIKEAARRQVACRKLLAKAEAAVKANPKDAAAQKKLGECYAELGNWPKALDAFACAGDDLAKTAAAEKDGTAAPQVSGDFWWDFEDGDEMSAYKLHAAELYRTALANDSFQGLARTRAEQRVKEVEDFAQIVGSSLAVKKIGGAKADLPIVAGGDIFRIVLDAQKNVGIDFVACPPGRFEDGSHPSGNHKKHLIELTYPFLIMPGRLTYAVLTALDRKIGRECRQRQPEKWSRCITDDTPVTSLYRREFDRCLAKLEVLAAKDMNFRKFHDYEFRLATQAEHEYACWAGDTGADMGRFGDADREKSWLSLGCPKGSSVYDYPPLPESYVLKTRGKNAWGLYDMFNGQEPLADRIPSPLDKDGKPAYMLLSAINDVYCYADEEINPLRWYTGKDACGVSRCQWIVRGGLGEKNGRLRLVYGPKLSALNVYPRNVNDGPVKRIGEEHFTAKTTAGDAKDSEACYPREDFGGELLSSKYEIVESSGKLRFVNYQDGLFNCQKPVGHKSDFAFEVSAKEKDVGFTLKLSEPITLAGLLVVNRTHSCKARQVPLCVWASEDRTKWERIFIDESVHDEYRIDLSKKNITCKYLRFGRLPGVNNEPFHLARTLVYVKKVDSGISQPSNSSSASAKAPSPKCKMIKGRPAPLKFELAKGIDLELEGCPAGKFTMGYAAGMWNGDGKAAPKHEVMITRPFWIGKFQVTRGQAKSLDVMLNDCHLEVQSAFDGKGGETCAAVMTFDNINAFCRKLTEKFAAEIPTGYVFRLASNAEWEYASKAGNYSEKNPAMLYSGHKESPYILTRHDKLALLKKKNIEWKDSPVVLPPFPGGLKRPNAWGIFDMLGNHPEVTMDRIPKNAPDIVSYVEGKESGIIRAITYAKQEMDPLLYCEADWNLLVRGRWDNYLLMEGLPANQVQYVGGHGYAFRVCLGPDLVAEKKAKGK